MDAPEPQRSKIFINPDFKKAHINRNFLPKTTTSIVSTVSNMPIPISNVPNIHLNPVFINKLHQQKLHNTSDFCDMTLASAAPVPLNPIIKHTKRKLIRASSAVPLRSAGIVREPLLAPLVKISKNKLVRSTPVVRADTVQHARPEVTKRRFSSIDTNGIPEKLNRISYSSHAIAKSNAFIRRYSLIRPGTMSPQNVIVTDRKLLKLEVYLQRIATPLSPSTGKVSPNITFASPNKKLVMININGVLYRSSTNKLQLSATQSLMKSSAIANSNRERCLKIRGTRFLLNSRGTKLRKVPSILDDSSSDAKLRRIDIGGLTYKPKTDGTFVKTDVHRTRAHLSLAKQKSILFLTNKMRKCNVPCQIFRRLGRCAAYMQGRCPKLHDPNQVSICSRFLKGECSNSNCLLSHNISLEKMPVCHFYLEGRCDRNECPYLHKKVSENERICEDFLKGFCALADKCQRRHVFVCPEFDRLGLCKKVKCPYPHGRKNDWHNVQQTSQESKSISLRPPMESTIIHPENIAPVRRYYLDNLDKTDKNDSEQLSGAQKDQLKRVMKKVEKMKQGHIGNATKKDTQRTFLDTDIVLTNSDNSDESDREDDKYKVQTAIRQRPKLGRLPSYIPI
ncbi:zinc finger CCCH domain-containing protein 3 [Malaya genurostris]|uniref:zinc finger CCCH domain-containing protein 3 n=1 Tax=Malaya genurostris TaxID=325434 RepID=UPI0026F4071A|nr:zinc finger CCCH domain-containing protein 3 [Malaya genurostris]